MRGSLSLLTVASVLLISSVARADSYVVTISGANYNGSITLTGSATGFTDPGAIFLTSATGTINSRPVDLIPVPNANFANQQEPTGANAFVGIFVDNELYPNSPSIFDAAGILLETTDNLPTLWLVPFIDPANGGAQIFQMVAATRAISDSTVTFSIAPASTPAVPEPSSLVLMTIGLASLAGFARRFRPAKA